MANPTIYRYARQINHNRDGYLTQVERSLRQNRDISIIVKVKDASEHHLVVYHNSLRFCWEVSPPFITAEAQMNGVVPLLQEAVLEVGEASLLAR